jgi:hypothetical protein
MFFILVFLVNAFEDYKIQQQKFITIYNINQTFAMQIFDGSKSIFIADTSLLNNSDKLNFHIRQHIWACGIIKIDTIPYLNNLQISINKAKLNIGKTILPNNINILTQNTFIDTNLLKNNFNSVIISSKLKVNHAQNISKFLNNKNINVNNVMENGAFTFNIEP